MRGCEDAGATTREEGGMCIRKYACMCVCIDMVFALQLVVLDFAVEDCGGATAVEGARDRVRDRVWESSGSRGWI